MNYRARCHQPALPPICPETCCWQSMLMFADRFNPHKILMELGDSLPSASHRQKHQARAMQESGQGPLEGKATDSSDMCFPVAFWDARCCLSCHGEAPQEVTEGSIFIFIFRYRRRAHVTPKSYLSFINGYKNIYTEKVKYINEQAERMNIGKRGGLFCPFLKGLV